MTVLSESHPEAWRCVHGARWRLLESYALARHEGLARPIGLVVDTRAPRAVQLFRQLMLNPGSVVDSLQVSCVERGALCSALASSNTALAQDLFARGDEPGTWTALVLGTEELVLSATWQELISGAAPRASMRQRSR